MNIDKIKNIGDNLKELGINDDHVLELVKSISAYAISDNPSWLDNMAHNYELTNKNATLHSAYENGAYDACFKLLDIVVNKYAKYEDGVRAHSYINSDDLYDEIKNLGI